MIEIELTDIHKFIRYLDPKKVVRANNRAMKTTGTRSATAASRAVRDVYNVKAGLVKDALNISFEPGTLEKPAEEYLVYRGARLGLEKFSANVKKVRLKGRGRKRFGNRRKGVTVKIRKDRPRMLVKIGFLATTKGGQTLVFKRDTRRRLPVSRLKSLSLPEMMRIRKVEQSIESKTKEVYPKEFTRLLNLELNKVST
jgi:hypothetical protein